MPKNISVMSRLRHLLPFKKYNDWPSRVTKRLIAIWFLSAKVFFNSCSPNELSKISSTEACEMAFRLVEPLKITSVMASPRKFLAELSPSTHLTASITLDLPQPFGPTTQVI